MYFFADLKIVQFLAPPPPHFDKSIYINTIIIPSIYQILAIALKNISYRPTFLCQCILTVVNFESIGQCLFHHNRLLHIITQNITVKM